MEDDGIDTHRLEINVAISTITTAGRDHPVLASTISAICILQIWIWIIIAITILRMLIRLFLVILRQVNVLGLNTLALTRLRQHTSATEPEPGLCDGHLHHQSSTSKAIRAHDPLSAYDKPLERVPISLNEELSQLHRASAKWAPLSLCSSEHSTVAETTFAEKVELRNQTRHYRDLILNPYAKLFTDPALHRAVAIA